MTLHITDDAIWTEVREAAAIHGWDDRAAAIKKAERDGNKALADHLRASGALPE